MTASDSGEGRQRRSTQPLICQDFRGYGREPFTRHYTGGTRKISFWPSTRSLSGNSKFGLAKGKII